MIQAESLRIGNLISFKQSNPDAKVKYLPFKVTAQDILEISLGSNVLDHKPLELTEEWLIKFGFERYNDDEVTLRLAERYYLSFDIIGRKGVYTEVTSYTDKNASTYYEHIKYVHQLQNLYHSLTGEELTLNP